MIYNWLKDAVRQKNNLPLKKNEIWRLSIIMLSDDEKVKITIKELRKFKGFENISDSECEEIIESLLKLSVIVYNLK